MELLSPPSEGGVVAPHHQLPRYRNRGATGVVTKIQAIFNPAPPKHLTGGHCRRSGVWWKVAAAGVDLVFAVRYFDANTAIGAIGDAVVRLVLDRVSRLQRGRDMSEPASEVFRLFDEKSRPA